MEQTMYMISLAVPAQSKHRSYSIWTDRALVLFQCHTQLQAQCLQLIEQLTTVASLLPR